MDTKNLIGTPPMVDVHHDGGISSHPYRMRVMTSEGWKLILGTTGQPRKFQSMTAAVNWLQEQRDADYYGFRTA